MKMRSKLALITLGVGVTAGAVGVTQSWFLSLNRTPPGNIASALVRYLPETTGDQSLSDLLTYGNLIGGVGVDEEGIPHVLPGEELLSTVVTQGAGESFQRTVNTSRVRSYQTGETVRTVIRAETRSYEVTLTDADGTPLKDEEGNPITETRQVIHSRRDLFDAKETVVVDGVEMAPDKLPDLTGWELLNLITTRHPPVTDQGKTVTVIVATATYVWPEDPARQTVVVTTTTETVTHEAPRYTGGTDTDFQGGTWLNTMSETVLALLPNEAAPTSVRTQITITGPGGDLAPGTKATLPLSVGNLSTVDTNLRLGVTGTVTATREDQTLGQPQPLELRGAGSTYYLGLMAQDGNQGQKFIELLELELAENWVQATEGAEGANVWDWKQGESYVIPPRPDAQADPALYAAVTKVAIATKPSDPSVTQEDFELLFNQLYAENNALIELRVRFYAKQADYMDWAEFYTTELGINVSAAVSAGLTGGEGL